MPASLRITLTDSSFALRMVPGVGVATATSRSETISVPRHRMCAQPTAVRPLRHGARRRPATLGIAKPGWCSTRKLAEANTR